MELRLTVRIMAGLPDGIKTGILVILHGASYVDGGS